MAEFVPGQTVKTTEAVLPVENLPEGRHTFRLRVEDDAGNLSQPALVTVVVRGPAPRVTSFDPGFGRVETRVVLRVSGLVSRDFAEDHEVQFNGVKAPVTGGSSKTIHALVPEGATSGPLSLITRNGRGVSEDLFHIPRGMFLPWPGPSAPAFGPDGGLLAALDPEGRRVAIWNLKKAAVEPNQPPAEVELKSRATRLLWLATPGFSGFVAWDPGSTAAHAIVPGEDQGRSLRLPGRAVDIQTPAAGLGIGAAGLFQGADGRMSAHVLPNIEQPFRGLDVGDPRAIALSQNGRRLALATGERVLLEFALPDERQVEKVGVGGNENIDRVFIGDAGGIWALASRGTRAILAREGRVSTLDLGLRMESAGISAKGDGLLTAGGNQRVLLAVRALRAGTAPDRLIGEPVKLPHAAQSPFALTQSPEGQNVAVLHHGENAISFVAGGALERTVTLPLEFLEGVAFTGSGKLPTAASSPRGRWFAFATEKGVIVVEAGSVIP